MRTRGGSDIVVVDLPRGKYRVIVSVSDLGPAMTSASVRLER